MARDELADQFRITLKAAVGDHDRARAQGDTLAAAIASTPVHTPCSDLRLSARVPRRIAPPLCQIGFQTAQQDIAGAALPIKPGRTRPAVPVPSCDMPMRWPS